MASCRRATGPGAICRALRWLEGRAEGRLGRVCDGLPARAAFALLKYRQSGTPEMPVTRTTGESDEAARMGRARPEPAVLRPGCTRGYRRQGLLADPGDPGVRRHAPAAAGRLPAAEGSDLPAAVLRRNRQRQ